MDHDFQAKADGPATVAAEDNLNNRSGPMYAQPACQGSKLEKAMWESCKMGGIPLYRENGNKLAHTLLIDSQRYNLTVAA